MADRTRWLIWGALFLGPMVLLLVVAGLLARRGALWSGTLPGEDREWLEIVLGLGAMAPLAVSLLVPRFWRGLAPTAAPPAVEGEEALQEAAVQHLVRLRIAELITWTSAEAAAFLAAIGLWLVGVDVLLLLAIGLYAALMTARAPTASATAARMMERLRADGFDMTQVEGYLSRR